MTQVLGSQAQAGSRGLRVPAARRSAARSHVPHRHSRRHAVIALAADDNLAKLQQFMGGVRKGVDTIKTGINTVKSGVDAVNRFRSSLDPSAGKAPAAPPPPAAYFSPAADVPLAASGEPEVAENGRDNNTVFVAGATGRLGVRVVRELLAAGFNVRAGTRDIDKAAETARLAQSYGVLSSSEVGRLEVAQFDLEDPASLAPAIGNANKVVCCVGAPESAILDTTAPKRIDGDGISALVFAAADVGVESFTLVSSLGTGRIGFPASVLNLFWGVLNYKRNSEKVLENSGMRYTIIRPGGMEKPTDDYKLTHNVVLARRDSRFGGQVSRLQVAELIAACLKSPELSLNKCVEVVAEEEAPAVPYERLLAAQESETSREQQLRDKTRQVQLRVELQDAQGRLREARAVLEAREGEAAALGRSLAAAQESEAQVRAKWSRVLSEGRSADAVFSAAKAAAKKAELAERASRMVLEAARRAGSGGQLLTRKEALAIEAAAFAPPPPSKAAGKRPNNAAVGTVSVVFGTILQRASGLAAPSAPPQQQAKLAPAAAAAAAATSAPPAFLPNPFNGLFTPSDGEGARRPVPVGTRSIRPSAPPAAASDKQLDATSATSKTPVAAAAAAAGGTRLSGLLGDLAKNLTVKG